MGRFTYVNVGDPGSLGDAACWNKSPLYLNLATALSLPPDVATFMIDDIPIAPFIVADAAFALSEHVMKCFEVTT